LLAALCSSETRRLLCKMPFSRSTMKKVSAHRAKREFSELLSRVERGEEILITKRSRPVALLSPIARRG